MSFDHLAAAEKVAAVAAQHAVRVDARGEFPAEAVATAREAGLLALGVAASHGGHGGSMRAMAEVVERVARACGSSAMVLTMHYCGAAVLEAHGSDEIRRGVAEGRVFTTLAFSESGSRSHFWASLGRVEPRGEELVLTGQKTWVTSAHAATHYVWSSAPVAAEGLSSLWLVPRDAPGLRVGPRFDGLGLRGNDSTSVVAEGVVVPQRALLGKDGGGFDVMMSVVLPLFNVLNAGNSVGLCEGAIAATVGHVGATRHEHLGASLVELATIRAYLARMRIRTDQARALWLDTLAALEAGRSDVMLRVLEVKASAGDAALEVLDTAMRVCGGAAFRKEVGVERRFRDGRAGAVMAPTSDQLYDFIGKAVCGLPLF